MSVAHNLPPRLSTIAGSLGALLIMLSAPVHSLVGWPELQSQLARLNAPAELVQGLQIGWHFAGAAMVAFGLIVLHAFQSRARGTNAPVPSWTVAALYLLFGGIALVVSGFDPFFLVFIVPGALVLVGVLT